MITSLLGKVCGRSPGKAPPPEPPEPASLGPESPERTGAAPFEPAEEAVEAPAAPPTRPPIVLRRYHWARGRRGRRPIGAAGSESLPSSASRAPFGEYPNNIGSADRRCSSRAST